MPRRPRGWLKGCIRAWHIETSNAKNYWRGSHAALILVSYSLTCHRFIPTSLISRSGTPCEYLPEERMQIAAPPHEVAPPHRLSLPVVFLLSVPNRSALSGPHLSDSLHTHLVLLLPDMPLPSGYLCVQDVRRLLYAWIYKSNTFFSYQSDLCVGFIAPCKYRQTNRVVNP